MRIVYEEQVSGRLVIDSTGRTVGEVESLYLNPDSLPGRLEVAGLRIKLRSEVADDVGVQHSAFHPGLLDVPTHAIQALGESVILRADVAMLVPRASVETPPPTV